MANKMLPSGISVRIREDLIDGASRVQTTLIVDPIITLDGHRLLMTDIGDIGYGKIDGGTSREEIITWTGITDNTSTYTLTGCVWGLNFYDLSNAVANYKRHTSGAKFEIKTDMHYIAEQFISADTPTASTGYSPASDLELTTRAYVDNRDGYWEGAVANYAALTAGATDGEVRVTLDDSKIYVWDEGTTTWILAGAGGGAGTVYITSLLGTEATGADNKTFTMASGSFTDKKYLQVYLNGVLMDEGATDDYVATGSDQAVFNTVVADTDRITLLVVSVDLYNPAWNSVNADVLPDVDSAYDIGSGVKKFKKIYVEQIDGEIDPDNLTAQTAGYLTGGTDIVLADFETLRAGDNDGKFNINIDGVDYEDIEVSLPINTDLSSASYDSKYFSVSSQDTYPTGIFFNPTGTKMYIAGGSNDRIYQYSLSTAWDVSSASYDSKSFDVSSQDTSPSGIFFNLTGTKMYMLGGNNDTVYQYSLSTAWDVSSASYDSKSFDVSSQETSPNGIFFNPTGDKMYVIGYSNDTVYQYSLSTAWDVSSASYDSKSLDVGSQNDEPRGIFFNSAGDKMYIAGYINDTIYQYSLSTAWDISTASYSDSFYVNFQSGQAFGVFLNPAEDKMYIHLYNNDAFYQYSLPYANDITRNIIASSVQTAIRAATGSTETVIYDTDHFIITSATFNKASQVLKLTAPSTGIDISVAGYLDLGVNATETQGDGKDYRLVRLDRNGKIDPSLLY